MRYSLLILASLSACAPADKFSGGYVSGMYGSQSVKSTADFNAPGFHKTTKGGSSQQQAVLLAGYGENWGPVYYGAEAGGSFSGTQIAGRIGAALCEDVMPYVKAGYAYDHFATVGSSGGLIKAVGVEVYLFHNVSARAEVSITDYASTSSYRPPGHVSFNTQSKMVGIGLTYHF